MARRPYSTWVRPFRDSDMQVKINWYPARPEDGTLPFPSGIASLDWHAMPEQKSGVGEVFKAPRPYNGARPIPGPARNHVCGTADEHRYGGFLSDPRPLARYLPSGLPICCEPDRRETVVSVGVGVQSRYTTGSTYRSTVPTAARTATRTRTDRPRRSTICTGCDAIVSTTTRVNPFRSTVGVAVDPQSETVRVDPYHSTVGVAIEVRSIVQPAGPCRGSGPTCVDALVSPLNRFCSQLLSDDGFDQWFRWNLLPDRTYEIRTQASNLGGFAAVYEFWIGDSCLTKVVEESGVSLPADHVVPVTLTGSTVWYRHNFYSLDRPTLFVEIGVFEVL